MAASLTATVDTANADTTVNVQWTGTTPLPTVCTITRIHEDGSTYGVRNAEPATLNSGQFIGDDFEVPLDTNFYYEATNPSNPTVLTSATYNIPSQGRTALRHPGKPTLNQWVNVAVGPNLSRPVDQGVFDVLGRRTPIAISMRRSSQRGELTLVTWTESDRQNLLALTDDGMPLLMMAPEGYGFDYAYLALGDLAESRISGYGGEPTRIWTLPFIVCDRPAGAALASGNAWSDVLAVYSSWRQVKNKEPTWSDLLTSVG